MYADALDDIARQVAAGAMSRRSAHRAAAAVMVAGSFRGLAGRPPGGRGRVLRAAVADESPDCDWSGAGPDCEGALALMAACVRTCTTTGIGCAGCMVSTRNQAERCEERLKCT